MQINENIFYAHGFEDFYYKFNININAIQSNLKIQFNLDDFLQKQKNPF